MRVLVSGANGQLGYSLQQSVPANVELIACSRKELDLSKLETIHAVLEQYKPDAIINTAAYTAVDKAEEEKEQAFVVNAEAVKKIAEYCELNSLPFIQVSTDFVFDGTASVPYSPADAVNPLGVYGASKLAGEQFAQELCQSSYIVRTSWVYSEHGNNFVKTMLRLAKERDQLGIIADQIGTPTYALNLAQVLWQILIERPAYGVYHFSDAGVASWYDFAVAVFEEAKLLGQLTAIPKVKPISTCEYPTPAKRPAYSVMDKSSLTQVLNLEAVHWRQGLRMMLQRLSSYE